MILPTKFDFSLNVRWMNLSIILLVLLSNSRRPCHIFACRLSTALDRGWDQIRCCGWCRVSDIRLMLLVCLMYSFFSTQTNNNNNNKKCVSHYANPPYTANCNTTPSFHLTNALAKRYPGMSQCQQIISATSRELSPIFTFRDEPTRGGGAG